MNYQTLSLLEVCLYNLFSIFDEPERVLWVHSLTPLREKAGGARSQQQMSFSATCVWRQGLTKDGAHPLAGLADQWAVGIYPTLFLPALGLQTEATTSGIYTDDGDLNLVQMLVGQTLYPLIHFPWTLSFEKIIHGTHAWYCSGDHKPDNW